MESEKTTYMFTARTEPVAIRNHHERGPQTSRMESSITLVTQQDLSRQFDKFRVLLHRDQTINSLSSGMFYNQFEDTHVKSLVLKYCQIGF